MGENVWIRQYSDEGQIDPKEAEVSLAGTLAILQTVLAFRWKSAAKDSCSVKLPKLESI
jgi:hypothetical protein